MTALKPAPEYYHPRGLALTAAEKNLFAAIETRMQEAYFSSASQFHSAFKGSAHSADDQYTLTRRYNRYYLFKAVRAAARHYYSGELMKAAESAVASGEISAEDAKALKDKFTINAQPLSKVFSFSRTDNGNVIIHLSDDDYFAFDAQELKPKSVQTIEATLSKAKLSENAKKLAHKVLDSVRDDMNAYDRTLTTVASNQALQNIHGTGHSEGIGQAAYTEDLLFKIFSLGKCYHTEPVFRNVREKEQFTGMLSKSLSNMLINRDTQHLAEADIRTAIGDFADRISKHDLPLLRAERQEQARKDRMGEMARRASSGGLSHEEGARLHAEAERERQRAELAKKQQDLIAQAERKRVEYESFMASPRPHVLDVDSDRMMHVLEKLAQGEGYKAPQARGFVNAVEKARGLLDQRDGNLKETGALLLSPSSLQLAAKAAGMGESIKNISNGAAGSLKERSGQLRLLYQTSDAVKQAVDTLLADSDGALLVAVHVRGEERCASYAAAIGDSARKLQKIDKEASVIKARIGNYTDAEFRELLADPELKTDADIMKLNAKLAEQAKAQAEQDAVRLALGTEVMQAFNGMPPRKIGSAAGQGVTVEKTPAEERVPSGWFKTLGDDYHLQDSAQGDKFVAIHSNKYPDISIPMKVNATEQALKDGLERLEADCKQRQANRAIRKKLSKESGFFITSDQGKPILRHREYDITVPMTGSEMDRTKALLQGDEEFSHKLFEQQSMMRTLELAGVDVVRSSTAAGKATTFMLPDKSYVSLGSSGYFNKDEFAIAQGMLGQMGLATANGNGVEAPAAAPSTTESWKPGKDDNVIVFDANVLRRLSVSRGGNHGKTWVDIVKETAKLPGVTVVVPEVVIFELTGKMPTKGQNGHHRHYKLVDQSYTNEELGKTASAKHIESLLDTASYGQIEGNGEVTVKGGRNNVVVMSTPDDVDLYRRIQQEVLSAPKAERGRKLHDLIYHHDEGEQAISRIISALPGANYAVVTDDTNYSRKSALAVRATTQGKPVVYAGTGAYLEAEINASRERYKSLTKVMHCTEALSFYRVAEDIVRGGLGLSNYYDPVMRYSTSGTDLETGEIVSITSIIRNAAAKTVSGHAGGNGHANGAATNGGWAHEGLKRSGTPDEIARRAGQDESRLR